AHDPGFRLDGVGLDSAPLEDPPVGTGMELEAALEPFLVAVERVAVLHDELPYANEAAAGARLVPVLRLEVVPELRQLPVALNLAGVEGDRLLVRHGQNELAARPVGDVKDLRDGGPPGRLPQLGRRQD